MLIISRIATMQAGVKTGLDLATKLHTVVNKVMGIEVSLFAGGAGHPSGTFIFSARVDDMAEAQTEEAKLLGSKEYLALSEKASALAATPTESRIRSIVSIAPETMVDIPVGANVSSITAEIANGQLAGAMEFGTEMVSYYNSGTDLPVAFARNVSGNLAEVQWLSLYENGAAADKALEWEATDAGYMDRYAAAGDFFAQGSGYRTFMTRIA